MTEEKRSELEEQLKAQKLEAEIRKLNQDAEKAELEFERTKLQIMDDLADPKWHCNYSFIGKVDSDSVKDAMQALGRWSRREPGRDMIITFNSPGGSVLDGLALYDFIEELKDKGHEVTTVARGMAASMGGVLLQSGSKRLIGRNAYVLIHEVSKGAFGKMSEIEDAVEFGRRLQERLLRILADRSTLTARQIKTKWNRTDWWLDADEVIKLGFADAIG